MVSVGGGGGGGTLHAVADLLLRPSVFHSPFSFLFLPTFVLSFLSFPLVFCFDFIDYLFYRYQVYY